MPSKRKAWMIQTRGEGGKWEDYFGPLWFPAQLRRAMDRMGHVHPDDVRSVVVNVDPRAMHGHARYWSGAHEGTAAGW